MKSKSITSELQTMCQILEEGLAKPRPRRREEVSAHLTAISDSLINSYEVLKLRNRNLKRCVQRIRNTLLGIATGVTDNNISHSDFKFMLEALGNRDISILKTLIQDMEEEEEEKKAKRNNAILLSVQNDDDSVEYSASNSKDFKDALKKAIKESDSISPVTLEEEPSHRDEAIKDVQKYARLSKNLPVRLKNNIPFTLVELPIVPLFSDFNLLSPKKLNSLNIKYSKLPGFYILEKQIVLVFKKDELPNKPTKSQAKIIQQNNDKRVMQALEYVDILNERSPIKFSVLGNKVVTNPENPNLALMWLMPTRTVSKLQSMSGPKGLKLDYWGFPWDINKTEI